MMHKRNVKFYLKRIENDQPTSIYAKAQISKKPFKYYIRRSIRPVLWDQKSGEPTADKVLIKKWKKKEPQLDTILGNISSRINLVRDTIVSYVNLKEQAGHQVLHQDLQHYLNSKLGIDEIHPRDISLNQYLKDFIKDIKSGKRLNPSNKQQYAQGTIKNYDGFKVQFDEYQKDRRKKLDFKDINLDFYDDFVAYFQEKNNKPGAIGRYIKHLKHIMRISQEEGLHSNEEYKRRGFRVLTSERVDIYLSESEIKAISEVDLEDRPGYKLARDVFLVGCYTALRYSDYSRIKPKHIKEDEKGIKYVRIIAQKTGKPVEVPIRPELDDLLKKYNYELPKTYPQKVGEYIKKIAKKAGITDPVEDIQYKGANRLHVSVPKYKLISTHTARKSAATNMFLGEVPTLLIMKITDHQTEKDFMKYICIDKEQAARVLSRHNYFTRGNLKVI